MGQCGNAIEGQRILASGRQNQVLGGRNKGPSELGNSFTEETEKKIKISIDCGGHSQDIKKTKKSSKFLEANRGVYMTSSELRKYLKREKL